MNDLSEVTNRRGRSPLRRCPAWVAPLALALALSTPPAAAADAESPWALSGFATLGVASKSGGHHWGFARDQGEKGAGHDVSALVDSRAGLQLNWDGGPRWEGALQAVLRDRPYGTPAEKSLEWAYITHRPTPDLSIRLGRTSPDLFLFADSRSIGFALPWARPPVEFYGFIPVTSFDGGDVSRHWSWGGADWRGRIAGGRFATNFGALATDEPLVVRGRDMVALTLSREAEGLLVKGSYLQTRTSVNTTPSLQQLRAGLDQLGALPVPGVRAEVDALQRGMWTRGTGRYLGLGIQYEQGPWSLHAEGSHVRVDDSHASGRRGYLGAGYRVRWVTVYGLTSRSIPKHAVRQAPDLASLVTPVLGPALGQQAQLLAVGATDAANGGRYDQHTLAGGLRWDAASNTAVKLQLDRIHVHANGSGAWRYGDARPASATVVTVLVDFTWGH
jgi:hypothetical protein